MRIGTVSIAHSITLAPMEEHTNYPFRLLCKQLGASLVCGERVDASDVAKRDRRAIKLLHTTPTEKPVVGQISGSDPHELAEAAKVVAEQGFSIVDLNFECPIRRLIGRGEGGALMSDPPAIARLVAAVVRAVDIPVTIKIRTGPDGKPRLPSKSHGWPSCQVSLPSMSMLAVLRRVTSAVPIGPSWQESSKP